MDGETLQQKTTHKGRKNTKLPDLRRQEGGGEYVWNISEQIQDTTGHHGAKTKSCHRQGFYMCGVAQHYYYYYVFILSTISPYTTGLKALFSQSDSTGTAPTHK